MSLLHWFQHLLHCQVRTFKDFPDYKVLSVNICSISFFSDYFIFSFIISQPVLVEEVLQPSDHLQSQHYHVITSVKEAWMFAF